MYRKIVFLLLAFGIVNAEAEVSNQEEKELFGDYDAKENEEEFGDDRNRHE